MKQAKAKSRPQDQFRAQVDASGRILIPAALRRRFALEPGAVVSLHAADGHITLRSRSAAIRAAQAYFGTLRKPGELWSEDLIRERHAEARRKYGH